MKILDLIADGVTNAQTLAASVTTKIKRKEDAQKALTNCFTSEHIFVLKELLKQVRGIQTQIRDVENELTERRGFKNFVNYRLKTLNACFY